MKRTLVLVALMCLVSGCSWMGGHSGRGAGASYSGASGLDRGTTGVSTGADADSRGTITGSGSAYH